MSDVSIQEKSNDDGVQVIPQSGAQSGSVQVIPRDGAQSTGQIVHDARAAVRIATRGGDAADDSVATPVTSGTSYQIWQEVRAVQTAGGGTEYIRVRD